MSHRRLAARFACMGLVIGACNGVVADDTTTSVGDTTTAVGAEGAAIENCEAATEGADFESTGEGETHFAYLPNFLVVPATQEDEAETALESIDHELVDVAAVLGEADTEDPSLVAARNCLDDTLTIFRLNGEDDALTIANDLRSDTLAIAPVHAFGEVGHSGYKTGTDPVLVDDDVDIEPPTQAEEGPLAAVVDSGIYPDTEGLTGSVVYTQGFDEEPGGDSHGTFVASIIRQLAPDHRITFARAPMRPVGEFAWSDDDPGDLTFEALTTELDVAEAILRLVHRHQGAEGEMMSLNLSLGAHSAVPGQDPWVVATTAALQVWFATFPEAEVFSAGGNADVPDPLWPGALDAVISVGALSDPSGEPPFEIVWDENQAEISPTHPRTWIELLAPGSMLANYSQPGTWVYWSGSSFASAVANGLHLRGKTALVDPANPPPRRSDVSGLTYWDGNKVAVAP